jgi:DnaJ-like protein
MPRVTVNRWSLDIEDPAKVSTNRRRRVVEIFYRTDNGPPVFVCSAMYSVELAKLSEPRYALATTENDRAKIRSQWAVMESAIAEKLWEDAPENPKNAGGRARDEYEDIFGDFDDLWESFGFPRDGGGFNRKAREVWERVRQRAAAGAGPGPSSTRPNGREHVSARSGLHVSDDDLRTLGLSRGASWSEVSKAFRKKARDAHPDVGGDAARMVAINQAYQRLREAMGQ